MIQSSNKKRHVVSYENMSPELQATFNEKYPKGFQDYLGDLVKYFKPDGTPFYAVTVETSEVIYLVKIQIKTDDIEDIERWLEGEGDDDDDQVTGSSVGREPDESTLPDDNIAQYGSDDADSSEDN